MSVHCVLDAKAILGEGPVWCDRRQVLFWVDILAPAVHRFDPATRRDSVIPMPMYAGSLALTTGEQLVVVLRRGLSLLHWDTGALQSRLELEPGQENRLNDGKCDARGRFWVGSMNLAEKDRTGALYRVDRDWSAARMLDSLIISNGIAWSPDHKRMYLADSGDANITVFDFDVNKGTITNRTIFTTDSPRGGVADGLCMDIDGCLWAAFWDGGCIVRFTPAGIVDRIIELPVPRPTSLTFGGADLKSIFVTSARCGLNAERISEQCPLSGSIFAIDGTGAQGLPAGRMQLQGKDL